MSDAVLLHIGYVKTATTFLQDCLFSQASLGFGLPGGIRSRAEIVQEIVLADDYTFDPAAVRVRLAPMEEAVRTSGLVPVWSDETLLGDPMVRRYDGPANAQRLARVFENAKVLITIREQRAAAYSIYSEFIRQGGRERLEQVIGTGTEPRSFSPILRPDFLMYDRAVRHYRDLFGEERVLVLPQEWLRRDPAAYFAALSTFTGRDIPSGLADSTRNPALGAAAQGSLHFLNRFIVKNPLSGHRSRLQKLAVLTSRSIDRLMPDTINASLTERHKAAIAARYADTFQQSNAALAAMTGLPLAALGYLLPSA